MAEETKTTASETPAPAAEVVVSDVAETAVVEKEATVTSATPEPEPVPVPEAEKPAEEPAATEAAPAAEEAEKTADEEKITESASFKEETNVVEELPDPQKKAIDELKQLVREALAKHEFTAPPPPPPVKEEEKKPEPEEPKTEAAATEEPKTESTAEETKPEPAAAVEETKTEAAAEETKPEEEKKEAEATPPLPAAEEPPKAEEPSEPVEEKKEVIPPTTETAESSEPTTKVEEKVETAAEEIKETIVEETTAAPATEPAAEETPKEEVAVEEPPKEPEEVSLWGIPLLADERSDVILLKFLRARDFKVKDAFAMLKSVVAWRKEFGIDELVEEEGIGSGLEKVVYMHGVDKEGHPVCYNAYGEFQDKEVYQIAFADAEKRSKFLRWRIQFLENSIRKLDFTPDGVNTIVQVNDFQNSPGLFLFKKDFRQATNQALQLLQDNYPEFVAKQVFINVPWWYVAYNRVISPFLTQRTKSKFVFVGPSKTAETLFKYIAPEQVPVQYGGLSRDEGEFTVSEPVTEETIKPSSKQVVEFPVTEGTLVWEARVIGGEVSYGAEFVPSAEGGYTVIVQKSRKITPTDEPIISGSYKIGEPGKIVLTFDNQTSKKKKLLYRSKVKSE
ncbi:OLC1v1015831C2 [Oldenlandia corymbosa var. corymbosa]|uniref:OLC1v1015831C2 n=1 Tax=Oldenlandia corymbosa var. corymbosa TaxID=529605 RepID=A0AAV1E411_OLDCO|nr:OLC1v1015831C2 [Oldenlandia corymbosa var. corymbosa]